MSETLSQVWFMPWAGLNKELHVGPVIFWPFTAMAANKIKEPSVREQLQRYFGCYVDHHGRPVSTVTICSYGTVNFRKLRRTQANAVRAAVDALIYSVVSPNVKVAVSANNRSMGPPSADRYQLLAQNLISGDDHIAVRAGNLVSGGWKIGELVFPQPWHLGGAFGAPDGELIEGWGKLFATSFPSEIRERLFRSLEWFRLSHTESDEVSVLSKIVMMATAFEILLQIPNVPNKKKWIAEDVVKRCATPKSLKATRHDKKGKPCTYPKIAWWAWDFYELRNKIVHGDVVPPKLLRYQTSKRKWLTHLIVADIVFSECIARELYAQECIGDSVRAVIPKWQKAFPEEQPEILESLLLDMHLRFEVAHRALGWMRQRRVKKKP